MSGHVISECLEAYLHVVSSCLAEKTFITDYHTTFSFTKDIDIFKVCLVWVHCQSLANVKIKVMLILDLALIIPSYLFVLVT